MLTGQKKGSVYRVAAQLKISGTGTKIISKKGVHCALFTVHPFLSMTAEERRSPIIPQFIINNTDYQVSDAPLNCIQVQSEGFLVAVGCEDGNTSLLELSDSLCQCTRFLILEPEFLHKLFLMTGTKRWPHQRCLSGRREERKFSKR